MRLLDRLDALDDRFGLGPRPCTRPPSSLTRQAAKHPSAFALVWTGLMVLVEFWTVGVGAGLVIVAVVQLVVGYVLAYSTRDRVQAWDRRHDPSG